MRINKFKWIFYIITLTIVSTIAVQLYWNYLNYKENKQRVSNEILASLDSAVETYYSNLSKKDFFSIISQPKNGKGLFFKNSNPISKAAKDKKLKITSLKITTDDPEEYKKFPQLLDSLFVVDSISSISVIKSNSDIDFEHNSRNKNVKFYSGKRNMDSLNLIKGLQSVFIAYTNDSINFKKLDSIFKKELAIKNIGTDYYFNYYINDTLKRTTKANNILEYENHTEAKSTYLRSKQSLKLYYTSTTFDALKKSFQGILISLFLALIIISSLFYLLAIIKDQKELASIKNDLISNITHEFKTPIATVSTAIEAIANFNAMEDKEKTKKYLAMSSVQLDKLHLMVEKLLETATLDSEKLMLKKEQVDVTDVIQKLVEKYAVVNRDKDIQFTCNVKPVYLHVDVFHFENVISNLLDNAVKYGGNSIEININSILGLTEISVADNGKGIEKNQQDKIFDKFYRIPKGNTHNVKGFGIGLYYCKKIIEKHSGYLSLNSTSQNTVFKISLPNA